MASNSPVTEYNSGTGRHEACCRRRYALDNLLKEEPTPRL
jgi:hypothetical protein